VLGNYANAGIDSIELARAIVMNLSPENCFEAFELSSALGLRGISRAVLDVIEVKRDQFCCVFFFFVFLSFAHYKEMPIRTRSQRILASMWKRLSAS
jgi:hypothetical protein